MISLMVLECLQIANCMWVDWKSSYKLKKSTFLAPMEIIWGVNRQISD